MTDLVEIEVNEESFQWLQALKREWNVPDIDSVICRLIDDYGDEYLKRSGRGD